MTVHIIVGIILLMVSVGAWFKALRIAQDPLTSWSERWVRFATSGGTRPEWVRGLRLVYGAMGLLTLVIAILLLATA